MQKGRSVQSGPFDATLAKKSLQKTNRVSVFEHAVDFPNFQVCNVRGCMFVLFSFVPLVFLAALCFPHLSSSAHSRSRQASAASSSAPNQQKTNIGNHNVSWAQKAPAYHRTCAFFGLLFLWGERVLALSCDFACFLYFLFIFFSSAQSRGRQGSTAGRQTKHMERHKIDTRHYTKTILASIGATQETMQYCCCRLFFLFLVFGGCAFACLASHVFLYCFPHHCPRARKPSLQVAREINQQTRQKKRRNEQAKLSIGIEQIGTHRNAYETIVLAELSEHLQSTKSGCLLLFDPLA